MVGKIGRESKACVKPLGGLAVLLSSKKKNLMSIKFLEGFVMDPLRVWQQISQGLPISLEM